MRNDKYGPWLVGGGLLAAVSQPLLLGFIGTLLALGCALALGAAEPAARMDLLLMNEVAVLDHCEALLTDAT